MGGRVAHSSYSCVFHLHSVKVYGELNVVRACDGTSTLVCGRVARGRPNISLLKS